MRVFEFEKSLLDRMEETRSVLDCKNAYIPAESVRDEWVCHVELKIEPAGWQALWKINRVTCERLNIKYPTVVFGMVNNVDFEELRATFAVIAVQNDDIHLPEIHDVPLEDLWPTIDQENTELNVERTAECLDELRFFYRNVWMPWDHEWDECYDWMGRHLESRIRFCFDLKRNMSRPMADHIQKQLAEARYIADKRTLIEAELDDDFEENPDKVNELLRMKMRLTQLRDEMEMLINPIFRKTYESIHFTAKAEEATEKRKVFIVTREKTVQKQIQYLESTMPLVPADEVVSLLPSLKDCFKVCSSRDHIFIPFGLHSIKLYEPLNSNGYLKAVGSDDNKESLLDVAKNAVIKCEEDDNVLLTFTGDYTLENVTLDCRNVRLGVWCKSGTVTLKNCYLIGELSSTINSVRVADGATCILENTTIERFDAGIAYSSGGALYTGLDLNDSTNVDITSVTIRDCSKYGVAYSTNAQKVFTDGATKKIVSDMEQLRNLFTESNELLTFNGDIAFDSNKKGNILLVDQSKLASFQHSVYLEENYDESGFNGEDQAPKEARMDVSQ